MNAKSIIIDRCRHYINFIRKDKAFRLFWVSLVFFLVLLFCPSNIVMLFLTGIYVTVLQRMYRDVPSAFFLGFAALLPFSKGKSVSFLLLPSSSVHLFIQENVVSIFPLYVSDLLLTILLYIVVTRKIPVRHDRKMNVLAVLFGFFLCCAALSTAYAVYPSVSFLAWCEFAKLLVIFVLPLVVGSRIIGDMWQIIAASVCYQSMVGIMQYLNHGRLGRFIESMPLSVQYGKTAWEQQGLLRVSGTFSDPDLYATFLLMSIGFLCGLIVFRFGTVRRERILCLLGICVGSIGLLFSGNRIIYVYYALLLFWFFCTWVRHIFHKNGSVLFLQRSMITRNDIMRYGFILCFTILCITAPYVTTRLGGIRTVFSETGSGTFRLQMMRDTYRIGVTHPIGVGLGMMPYYFATAFVQKHPIYGPDLPHNLFFELFAETGITGLLFFLLFLYVLYRRFSIGRSHPQSRPFFIGAFLFLCCSLVYPLTFDAIEIISFGFLFMGLAAVEEVHQ